MVRKGLARRGRALFEQASPISSSGHPVDPVTVPSRLCARKPTAAAATFERA